MTRLEAHQWAYDLKGDKYQVSRLRQRTSDVRVRKALDRLEYILHSWQRQIDQDRQADLFWD